MPTPRSVTWRRRTVLLAPLAVAPCSAALAQGFVLREIWFRNNFRKRVRLMIHHADGYRNWHTHAWWSFAPYEGPLALALGRDRCLQRSDHSLYFYAECVDGTSYWDGTPPFDDDAVHVTWQGDGFRLRRAGYSVIGNRLQFEINE